MPGPWPSAVWGPLMPRRRPPKTTVTRVTLPEELRDWRSWYEPPNPADYAAVSGLHGLERDEALWGRRAYAAHRRHDDGLQKWCTAHGLLDEWGDGRTRSGSKGDAPSARHGQFVSMQRMVRLTCPDDVAEEWRRVGDQRTDTVSEQPPTYEVGQVVNGHRWTGSAWEPVTSAPTPKKPLLKRWWVWALGVLGLLVVVGVAQGAGGGSSSTGSGTPSSSPTTSTVATQSPSPTSAPPSSSAAAPAKSSAPAPNPVDDARSQFAQTFPTFTPIKRTGTSDAVIKLPSGVTAGLVYMSYRGSSNFIVDVLDSSNQSTGDGLANEIGTWKGSAPFGISTLGGSAAKIEVQAQGAWALTVVPLSTAPVVKFPAAGKGTGVYLYVGDASDWTLTHNGQANFIVDEVATDGSDNNLVNEIGKYSGQVPAAGGPALIVIQADGAWTINGS